MNGGGGSINRMNFLINKRMYLKYRNINFRSSDSAAGISFSS